ncbi:actin-related protein, ARP5 class [Piedraia hortae CBS 480.64]|uniref:Actin-related protein, ARP5 class n=1 Tax=Piedraia hortae CBS 480.64 TaxID=1314780 RepID=A0A6A7BYG5_9PEZI|nr:actin-related protein, ARP5 class [Piedraia hortae CBS 480.64]
MPHYVYDIKPPAEPKPAKQPPTRIYTLSEPPYRRQPPRDGTQYHNGAPDTAIVIDNGSSAVRAGWQTDGDPRLQFPPLMARYNERKLSRKVCYVGSEVYLDGTARGQAKSAYEPGSNIVNNWDVQEGIFDYIFVKLGIDGDAGVDRPVVLTEPLGNLPYARKVMSEMMYELYSVPKVAYGVDCLFSYDFNGGRTGLVVSGGNTSTNLIPVVDGQPLVAFASRLDWGRSHCVEYLQQLLKAKYPGLLAQGKVTDTQIEDLVRDHCYVSRDYANDMLRMLDWTGLEDRDMIVQLPFQEKEVVAKTEEELRLAEERRVENARRLREQAAKMRLDRLIRKEQELEYLKQLQRQISEASTKKEKHALLEDGEFKDENQLDRRIKESEKSIRKQRNKDVGDVEDEVPTYPLLDIPDDQLDEEELKQKRQQRLLKSNHEARARAKAEKAAEKERQAEIQRKDDERREADLDGWLDERRAAYQTTLQRIKERDRLKADLGNRKSQASQMRMKQIATLASDNPLGRKRRRGQDKNDDGFGADDADWMVYRDIQAGRNDDDEEDEEEDLDGQIQTLEAQLLQYDPHFTEQSTQRAQKDWTKSLVHSFLRGPWPFDANSAREANQMHINVERIRVPEVIFQPNMAGVDQAGIVEIADDLLRTRLDGHAAQAAVVQDVFLTGGYALFAGLSQRLAQELRAICPAEQPIHVRSARDPLLDAWRGAAAWAGRDESRRAFVTRQEWMEKGQEYLCEHRLGT